MSVTSITATQMPSSLKRDLKKDPRSLSPEQRKKIWQQLDELEKEAERKVEMLKEQDPFWFYEPSSGQITPAQLAFLQKYLKPEDIPQNLIGQQTAHASKAKIRAVFGGNQCLGGETEIFDPVKGRHFQVRDIASDFSVLAWNGAKLVPAKANKPFVKGFADLFEVVFANGRKIVATSEHKILTPRGFLPVRELRPGSAVYKVSYPESHTRFPEDSGKEPSGLFASVRRWLLGSTRIVRSRIAIFLSGPFFGAEVTLRSSAISRLVQASVSFRRGSIVEPSPLVHAGGDRSSVGTESDFQSGYRRESRLCDGQPQSFSEVGPVSFPSPADAPGHSGWNLRLDDRDGKSKHSRTYRVSAPLSNKHDCSLSCKLSFPDDLAFPSEHTSVVSIKFLRKDFFYDLTVPLYHNYVDSSTMVHSNSGKTTTCIIEALIKATKALPRSLENIFPKERIPEKEVNNIRIVCEDYTHGILRNNIPQYRKWVPREYLVDGKWEKSFRAEEMTLMLGKGGKLTGTIEFMSNSQNVGAFGGPPRDMVIYDEEPRSDIHEENLARFVTADDLDIMFGMTPTKGLSWVYDEIFLKEQDDTGAPIDCFKLTSLTNPKANMRSLGKILDRITSYDALKMRLLGEFVSLSGLVYGSLFDKTIHVILPFEIDYDRFYVVRGIDPHQVTNTAVVWVAVDREENYYVIHSYFEQKNTDELKFDLRQKATETDHRGRRKYRVGWSAIDPSCDSNIEILGGINVFDQLKTGANFIPGLRKADKYRGSIHAGVDAIKQLLKINPKTGRPRLFIFDIPENGMLINSFRTLERDTYRDPDKMGEKDEILERKHHLHAALRYIFQFQVKWLPKIDQLPSYEEPCNEAVGW